MKDDKTFNECLIEKRLKEINECLSDSRYRVAVDINQGTITFIKIFYSSCQYLHGLTQEEMIRVLSAMSIILKLKEEKI